MKVGAVNVLHQVVFEKCVPEWLRLYLQLDHDIQTVMGDMLREVSFVNGLHHGSVFHQEHLCLSFPWSKNDGDV
jgi:hypothetical protein